MNCSPTRSTSARASLARLVICEVTVFSCASASLIGSAASVKSVFGVGTPGIATGLSESSRYWTIIMAWFRSSTAWR